MRYHPPDLTLTLSLVARFFNPPDRFDEWQKEHLDDMVKMVAALREQAFEQLEEEQ